MRQYLNWKTYLITIALGIVLASVWYTNELASRLADQEAVKVQNHVKALELLAKTTDQLTIEYSSRLAEQNNNIPLILTDERDSIISSLNLDSNRIKNSKRYLSDQLKEFKSEHKPIILEYGTGLQKVYYGDSHLLTQLRYFPYVQLTIIILFLVVVLIALSTAHRSMQNQVWVGLSKETAHQLGTPLSSIEAWLELLKDEGGHNEAVVEMSKDLTRLKLVADRFSKVGSAPQLQMEDVMLRIQEMVSYMQKRAPSKVLISLDTNEEEIFIPLIGPLFDWVLENLMRNALDAMGGTGRISVTVENLPLQVKINVTDTGKGIPRHQLKKVFNPGFTTKNRGWGLGLSLSKRIVERYHHGSLYVKSSEVGKGTTFRIVLRR
jgi:signal transduction histidine kinase